MTTPATTYCVNCKTHYNAAYYKRHLQTLRHLNSLKPGAKPFKPKSRKDIYKEYYARHRDDRLKRSKRRYTPKDPINKQCQYIKMLFV